MALIRRADNDNDYNVVKKADRCEGTIFFAGFVYHEYGFAQTGAAESTDRQMIPIDRLVEWKIYFKNR